MDNREDLYFTRRRALAAGSSLAALISTFGAAGTTANAEESTPIYPPAKPGIAPKGEKCLPYRAACVRTRAQAAHGPDGSFIPDNLAENVERVAMWAERGADEVGAKLYCFSEFCLQPTPYGASIEQRIEGSIAADGPEIERLARAAQKSNAFLALSVNERIAAFPDRYFVSGMVIAPNGDLILNYRKFGSSSIKTRPGDILSAWLDTFGQDSLFPVADTEIGRLGFAIALDMMQPELVRGSVLKGAEVILNPTASISPQPGPVPIVSTMVRRVRAFENMAYVMLANLGPVPNADSVPSTRQPSEIIDYRGELLSASKDDGEGFTVGTLEIDSLRQARTALGQQNFLSALQMDVHRMTYGDAQFSPADTFLTDPIKTSSRHDEVMKQTIEDLVSRGILVPPGV